MTIQNNAKGLRVCSFACPFCFCKFDMGLGEEGLVTASEKTTERMLMKKTVTTILSFDTNCPECGSRVIVNEIHEGELK